MLCWSHRIWDDSEFAALFWGEQWAMGPCLIDLWFGFFFFFVLNRFVWFSENLWRKIVYEARVEQAKLFGFWLFIDGLEIFSFIFYVYAFYFLFTILYSFKFVLLCASEFPTDPLVYVFATLCSAYNDTKSDSLWVCRQLAITSHHTHAVSFHYCKCRSLTRERARFALCLPRDKINRSRYAFFLFLINYVLRV